MCDGYILGGITKTHAPAKFIMLIKLFIVFLLLLIIGSLGSGIFYLLQDNGKSNRVVRALTVRISLSILAFLVLMGSYYFGLIEPNHPFGPPPHQAPAQK